jgi:hypothetical protein
MGSRELIAGHCWPFPDDKPKVLLLNTALSQKEGSYEISSNRRNLSRAGRSPAPPHNTILGRAPGGSHQRQDFK